MSNVEDNNLKDRQGRNEFRFSAVNTYLYISTLSYNILLQSNKFSSLQKEKETSMELDPEENISL